MDTIGDAGRNGDEDLSPEDQTDRADNTVNEELEEHDLPPLPEGTAPDGPAPAA
jgi:hypothetical protein